MGKTMNFSAGYTTLPIIVRYCGSDTLIRAFSSGFVLSIMAPFTIIAIASLGHVQNPLSYNLIGKRARVVHLSSIFSIGKLVMEPCSNR